MKLQINQQPLLVFVGLCIIGACRAAAAVENCQPEMVETIPEGMSSATFVGNLKETPKVLIDMIENAKRSIKITSMYISLTDIRRAEHPSTNAGRQLLQSIVEATKRGVDLEVVIDDSTKKDMSLTRDVKLLEQIGTVYRLNMTRLFGTGVMHTKFMITDDENLYVGSSNFDWRSYTQVKEIGVYFENCKTMAQDLDRIFQTYKFLSNKSQIPDTTTTMDNDIDSMAPFEIPVELLSSLYNSKTPFEATTLSESGNDSNSQQQQQRYSMFLSGSPPKVFQQRSSLKIDDAIRRTDDLEALLGVIDSAQKYIKVSVMNYNVRNAYGPSKYYWPSIDNALRRAAIERNVRVELLFSDWPNTREEEYIWYRSLNAIQEKKKVESEPRIYSRFPPPLGESGGIFVKMFKVPSFDEFQAKIPFARVKHDKYVVTENTLYVGTSNWSPGYFEDTCGVGFVFKLDAINRPANDSSILDDMTRVFDRDFNSEQFASELI